jgi:thymidylate kinase
MDAMGMLIGSHCHTHRRLTTMPLDEARNEMRTSKSILEEMLGHKVDQIAFVGGAYNKAITDEATSLGFRYCHTTVWGRNQVNADTSGLLSRDTINQGMSDEAYVGLVLGRNEFKRQFIYKCKQAVHATMPAAAYGYLRKQFLSSLPSARDEQVIDLKEPSQPRQQSMDSACLASELNCSPPTTHQMSAELSAMASQAGLSGETVQSTRSHMLLDFCRALDVQGIPYVILSGYQEYPTRIDSDVDFMVSEADFDRLPEAFLVPNFIAGARLVQRVSHRISGCRFDFAKPVGMRIAYLHPDAAACYREGTRLWLHPKQVLASRRLSQNGFWIPAPAVEFEYYFIKRIDKGSVEARHLQQFARLLTEDPAGCQDAMARLMPPHLAASILEAIAACDVPWFTRQGGQLRAALQATPPREGVLQRLWNRMNEWRRLAARFIRPTGLVIAVLGPDGCGKTTLIEHIEQELAPVFRRVRRFHLRPHFGRVSDSSPVTEPHAQKPRGWLASTMKVFLFLIDYWVGWLRWVYPAKVHSNLVIFDRYYHDMLVDPARYRLPRGFFLHRLLAGLVPKPDIWLVLHAPPEVLVARKGEITLEVARVLSEAYARLALPLRATTRIDTGRGLEETLAAAVSAPLDYLATRTKNRIGVAE